jgi:hypothetical protein
MDDSNKLSHDGLPTIDNFYSMLTKENITDENYQHAQNIYKRMNCNSFKDYHMTYLKTDVLLLADVF